ncbi:efflux RND transporter periplasmic adaptor subunit [Thetidibacter halocola]|uniref:Efflux RND transporter periplasmic adaptor subunit n=1 Tax=Thetidibacter halocola TaxID=2827239 RepID=A0A8J8B905_9RHOB|nr:efflux RND transporter periplasmic adaptor subunit [Thetidibacter halocola]MBS0126796.1 efflux RND transporter periplasmic adaptor subunit [Thetidibacter halocola]
MTTDSEEMARLLGLGRHRKRWRLWPLLAVLVAGGIAIWLLVPFDGGAGKVTYVTDTVRRTDIAVTVSATGTVEPTDFVEISSELSGTISKVHVDFNDTVEPGTVLAELDTARLEAQLAVQTASLAAAEARIAIAEATLKEARADYERGLQLQERGVESFQTFLAQQASFERAQAELQSAIASRDLAQANVDLARVDLDKACICSPVKGVVLKRAVDEGQIVAASLSAPVLFTIAEDLARMELQVDIDEADIGRVAVGQKARFTVEAFDDRDFPAEITALRLAPETVDGVVTYKGILTLDNADLLLRPGMTATAEIVVAEVPGALAVPNAALRYAPPQEAQTEERSGGGLLGVIMPARPVPGNGVATAQKSVWVLRDDAAVEVAVTTGETDGSLTAILAGDLAEGDAVITDRFDGQ